MLEIRSNNLGSEFQQGASEIGGTLLGVPIIRTMVYLGSI